MRIDLHTHSSVSDGTDTPTRLVMKALTAGLDVIALTDHDTLDGIQEAVEAGRRMGIRVIPGVELSTRQDGHTVHLLGYGCDPFNQELAEEMARIRVGRTERIPGMIARLGDLGIDITFDDVMAQAVGSPSVGRPHVADALVAAGVCQARDEAFAKYLGPKGPAYVKRYLCPLGRGIDLIHSAGGVAIIGHPWARGGDEVLTAPVLSEMVSKHGLDGIEVAHQEHSLHDQELLSEMGKRLGLLRTGGSDYHGKGKVNNDLGCQTTRETALREILRRIRTRGGANF